MQGKPNEAYSYLEKAYHLERERVGDGHRDVGYILSNIALTQIWRREYEAAESAARAAINAFKNVPELDPNRIDAVRYLGYALLEGGKYEEAEPQLSIALDLTTRLYGRESRPTAEVLFHLGTLRYSLGQLTEAESIAREIIRIDHAIKSEAFSSSNRNALLVSVLLAQGRFAEAKAEAEATLEKLEHGIRDDHPYLLATRDLLGKSLLGLGRFQEAERIFRRNVELWGKQDGWIEHAVWSMSALGEALIGQGRIAEAEACLARASLQINDRTSGRQEQQRLREHKLRLQKLNLAKAVERPGVKQFSDASTVTR
jgi:Tetratricopeptide repeat.